MAWRGITKLINIIDWTGATLPSARLTGAHIQGIYVKDFFRMIFFSILYNFVHIMKLNFISSPLDSKPTNRLQLYRRHREREFI